MSQVEEVFWEALLADRRGMATKQNEFWRHTNAMSDSDRRCVYCGIDLVRLKHRSQQPDAGGLHVDHFIPTCLGGPHVGENLLASCASCNHSKKSLDWLIWHKAPSAAAEQFAAKRIRLMAYSHNHLIRDGSTARLKAAVMKRMLARWQHPRCVLRAALTAEVGLIGWSSDTQTEDLIAVLIASGAQPVAHGASLWRITPARFHDAIWSLIDHNAWIRRLDLGTDFPDPTPADDGTSRWWETSSSLKWIVRRRDRLPSRKPRDTRPTLDGWRPKDDLFGLKNKSRRPAYP